MPVARKKPRSPYRRVAIALLAALLALAGCRPVGPKPRPTPDPDPPGNALSVVVVYDAARETPQAAAVYSSPALRDYCKVNGHELRVIEAGAVDESGRLVRVGGHLHRRGRRGQSLGRP